MEQSELKKFGVEEDDLWLWGVGSARRAYLTFGCRYLPDLKTHRFAVWAPRAQSVSVVGDFNGWNADALPMRRLPGGIWCALATGIKNGMIYKYRITGADGAVRLKSDPFAFHAETGPATGSKVWSLSGCDWGDGEWMRARRERDPLRSPMSVYELHIGSWKKKTGEVFPNYRSVADELVRYCADMGYTHVELLPVTEYPFEGSWGYQVTGFYAPTSRYGTPEDFMYFVDALHRGGIGVIIDWVPAHFPRDEHGLAAFDGQPLYEPADPRAAGHPEWGTLTFDYSRPQVRSFLISSAMFFMDVYHIDGIRVDAVSSMLYLDYGRKPGEWVPDENGGNISSAAVGFLRQLNTALLTEYPGVVTIAEESTAFPLVTRPPEDGGLGFVFKWDMGYMHDMLDYMSLDPYFRSKCHDKLTFSMMYAFSENFILAFSHDEVVHGKKSMVDKMWGEYDMKFASLRALWGYTFAHPGKKLMFMGDEFAQFIEWNYKRQLDWLLLDYPLHAAMRRYIRSLNRLYVASGALWDDDCSWDGFKWLNVDDAQRSSVAFMRSSRSGDALVCAVNFTPERWNDFVIGLPATGELRELISSDDASFGGSGLHNATVRTRDVGFLDFACSAEITLPPMSAVWFCYTREERSENET